MAEHLPYRVGIGHDLALEDTDIIIQQPEANLVTPVERYFGIDGTHYEQNHYAVFHFGFIESDTLYQTILGQFGLNDNEIADVTIYARNDRMYWRKYNGVAHRPEIGQNASWNNMWLRDVNIFVTDLEEIA